MRYPLLCGLRANSKGKLIGGSSFHHPGLLGSNVFQTHPYHRDRLLTFLSKDFTSHLTAFGSHNCSPFGGFSGPFSPKLVSWCPCLLVYVCLRAVRGFPGVCLRRLWAFYWSGLPKRAPRDRKAFPTQLCQEALNKEGGAPR